MGLEPTPEMYVENMVEVFRGVRRVLRDNGIFWLNLGDSYAGSGKAGSNPEYQKKHTQFGQRERKERLGMPMPTKSIGYKPKDLMMIPFLVARALQQDGWYLRSVIPWLKNSAMPESVTDRPSSALEYFFLLTKSRKCFYDIEATRIPGKEWKGKAGTFNREKGKNTKLIIPGQSKVSHRKRDDKVQAGRNRRNTDWFMDSIRDILEGISGTLLHDENGVPIAVFCNPQPYKGAHFATFPPKLIEPCILAGTSPRACEKCGAPWERVVEKTKYTPGKAVDNERFVDKSRKDKDRKLSGADYNKSVKIIGECWQPTCTCKNEGSGRCIVLDPFAGSGTTLWVAEHYGRDSVGIELSEKYVKLIEKRMADMQQTIFSLGVEV